MSLDKLKRRASKLLASNRIKTHAQRVAAATIAREQHRWFNDGAAEARGAMTRLVVPEQDARRDRPTLLNKRPEQPILLVPVLGRRYGSFADYAAGPARTVANVVKFEYRPMELRVGEHSIVWWDLVPMSPVRDRETLVDEVLGIGDELRRLDPHGRGYITHLADKLDWLVSRMRLTVREDRLTDSSVTSRQAVLSDNPG